MSSENAANKVLVDVYAEGMRNLLSDSRTTASGITAFELEDCGDQFRAWPFGARLRAPWGRSGRKEKAVFEIPEGMVKSKKGRRTKDDRTATDTTWTHEPAPETQENAISERDSRRPLPVASKDEKLVFEEEILRDDGLCSPGAEKSDRSSQDMGRQDEKPLHGEHIASRRTRRQPTRPCLESIA